MSKPSVWVSPRPNGWAVQRAQSGRASRVVPTKAEAESMARDMARRDEVELIVQRQDGVIQYRDSYGSDSCPPRDQK